MRDDLDGEVRKLIDRLGLPEGFYDGLLEEDDWSFVIKVHALVEAVVTHLIVVHLGERELGRIFAVIELSDTRKGKWAFVKALGLLQEGELRFIRRLSELRNELVHDIQNVGFRFDRYLGALDENQRTAFAEAFGFTHAEVQELDGHKVSRYEYAMACPKRVVWQSCFFVLGFINLLVDVADKQREASRLREEMLEEMRGVVPGKSFLELAGQVVAGRKAE